MMKRTLSVRLAGLAVVLIALAGCGGGVSGSKVQGKLLMNGQPYQVGQGEEFTMAFVGNTGEGGAKLSCGVALNPDGTFAVNGPTNKGVPPGKYQITVVNMPSPYSLKPGATQTDKFKDKYSSPDKTPLSVEITSATKEVVVDLGKGTAAAS